MPAPETTNEVPWYLKDMRFCPRCGSRLQLRIPPDDLVARPVCEPCDFIVYVNPKVVAGVVVLSGDGREVLLGQRGIPPSIGRWTYPSGFLECGETSSAGAEREAKEECLADVDAGKLLAVYSIPAIAQVHLVYLGTLRDGSVVGAGSESTDARMFRWDTVPWGELAFPTTRWALEYAREVRALDVVEPQRRTKLPDGNFE